ncbi:hypothetical protein IMCC9480_2328 [Oxalobacteraceae bacterium IMCC9480]|nr:hypothetical protein IMCC9480_2328 [Oxalobacteraceae bacterium IMCC9480]NDP59314.1 hypothetical protein [Oxalobacteraceae bacterium]
MLPALQDVLLSGGDDRLVLDASGRSRYGCQPCPDPALVALGSSTASVISVAGYAAAGALHARCKTLLRHQPAAAVYANEAGRVRDELVALCGLPDTGAVLGASGTDLHLLAGHWLQPDCVVIIDGAETGSGLPAALRGKHYSSCAAHSTLVPAGAPLDDWQAALVTLSPRAADGSLRDPEQVDADCVAAVTQAAEAGRRVLLVLTDLSKTGLLVPGRATVLALQQRWPALVTVLVDACQFRLSAASVRDYLACGFLVALTGSKFAGGPTFCGVLLVPGVLAERYRDRPLNAAVGAYSCAADWPAQWRCGQSLPVSTNFGLLLRWQAALFGLQQFHRLPAAQVSALLTTFGSAVSARIASDPLLEALPVAPLHRADAGWDSLQTVFPFLLRHADGSYFDVVQTRAVHQALMHGERRYQLGQAVACGERDGMPVMALRLCVSALMVIAGAAGASMTEDALAALEVIAAHRRTVEVVG